MIKIDVAPRRRRLFAGVVSMTLLPVLGLVVSAAPAEAATGTTVAYYGANRQPINGYELSPTTRVSDVYTSNTGSTITLTLGSGATAQTCTGPVRDRGYAYCSLGIIWQKAGNVPMHVSYSGDDTYAASSSDSFLVVAPETTFLSLSSAQSSNQGTPVTLKAQMTAGVYYRYNMPAQLAPGQPLTFTLGSGATAQTCAASTDTTGFASCTIARNTQPVGSTPTSVTFAQNDYQFGSTASATLSTFGPTKLTADPAGLITSVTPPAASVGVQATLLDLFGAPVVGQVVVFSSKGNGPNGTGAGELCRATTDAKGVASCAVGGASGQSVLSSGYDAAFAAKGFYLASSAHGAPASTPAGPLPVPPLP